MKPRTLAAKTTDDAADVEPRIDSFLAKYTPVIENELRQARRRLRGLFPRGFELVFDNYNALVFGFSPDERSTGAIVSVVGYPRWVTCFFLDGTALQDPNRLLEGTGKQVRSIRLRAGADIDKPDVAALIAQATQAHEAAFADAPPLRTVVKTVVAKQRSRRPPDRAAAA